MYSDPMTVSRSGANLAMGLAVISTVYSFVVISRTRDRMAIRMLAECAKTALLAALVFGGRRIAMMAPGNQPAQQTFYFAIACAGFISILGDLLLFASV